MAGHRITLIERIEEEDNPRIALITRIEEESHRMVRITRIKEGIGYKVKLPSPGVCIIYCPVALARGMDGKLKLFWRDFRQKIMTKQNTCYRCQRKPVLRAVCKGVSIESLSMKKIQPINE